MNLDSRVSSAIWEKLRFFAKHGGVWHVQAFLIAGQLNVPEACVRKFLVNLARWGLISLRTWSNSAWREASFEEYPTMDAFFYNRDDANNVRVKPLLSF